MADETMTDSLKADDQDARQRLGISNFGSLEARVEAFGEWKTDIKEDIRDLNTSIKSLSESIMKLRDPKWAQWIAASAVFFTVLFGTIGAGWHMTIEPINTKLTEISSNLVSRETVAGYSREIVQLQDQYRLLDTTKMARADMSDMKADIKAKIDELNGKIDAFNSNTRRQR